MAEKPPKDLDWIPDNSTGISVPGTVKQDDGWIVEKVPLEFLNWFWNRLSRWVHYFSGQSQEYIIIDSANANEKDYDTLAAYIADLPVAGDKILVKQDEVIAAKMTFPAGITIKFLKGVAITTITDLADAIEFGSDITIEGTLVLETSHTGTLVDAIVFNGDSCNCENISIENKSTGTITNAAFINSGKKANKADIVIANTGGGTITNVFTDNSGNSINTFMVRDLVNDSIFTIPLATDSNDGFLLSADKTKLDNINNDFSGVSNVGVVTILGTSTPIASLSLGTLTTGDTFHVDGLNRFIKGGTAGSVISNIGISGGSSGVIVFYNGVGAVKSGPGISIGATLVGESNITGIVCRVTGSGTVTLEFSAISAGSNSIIAIGDGQLGINFIKKQ